MRKKLLLGFCALLFWNIALLAQTNATGKVIDDKGNGVSGASVREKGTKNGTVTSASGTYSLKVKSAAKLLIEAVGFESVEVNAGSNVTSSLATDTKNLNEVVVTGYQTLQKKAVTGSIATVKADQVKNAPIGSFDQMLQGQAAGTLIQANSGQPGAAANVIIRGVGSIGGGTEPLYILDGVQISAQNFASINPNDFETFNVLKDAAATSQYGSRGANGVIVLTTKKGKAGKTKFEYNAQYGQSRFPTNQLALMNTAQKLDYEVARGNPYGWSNADLDSLRKINTNWQDEITQTGITNNHQLSASGGNDKTTFFASLGLFNQSGTVVSTGLKRYNARLNLENKATDNLKFGLNSTVGWSNFTNTTEANTGIASPLNAVRWGNPYERKIDPTTGTYQLFISGQPNPFLDITETFRKTNELKIVANAYLEANLPFISKGLSFRTSWGIDYENWDRTNLFTRFSTVGQATTGNNGRYERANRLSTRYTGTTSLNYAKSFGNHTINVGYYNEYITRVLNTFGYAGFGLTGNLQNGAGMTVSSTYLPQLNEGRTENILFSNFLLANYSFKNRYFFNGSFRRDASSRFGSDFTGANFYSLSAGWVISDENWFKKIKFVDNLKITSSYGTVGNQEEIGDFASRETFVNRTYFGVQGAGINIPANPNLTWEERVKFNIGFNATMLKSRLIFGFEFYNDITNKLFLNAQVSRTTGTPSQLTNIGSVQNRGFEFTLITQNIVTRNFTWSTNINFTINNNKILALDKLTPPIGIVSGVGVTRVGLPLFSNFLVESAGVDPNTGDQLYKKPDGTITNVYNDATDRQVFGTRLAPYFGGFTNKFTYKHLEASIFFSYSFGNQVYNNDRVNVEDPSYYWDNMSTAVLREWRKPGDITDIPRANQIMRRNQSRFLEDGSFLRLRNVQIAYNMPSKTAEKLKVRSIRMFIMGENLWTGFKLQAWDPELGTGGVLTGAQYPALRTFTGGITVGF